MSGYIRVSPQGSNVPLVASLSGRSQTQMARAGQYVNPNAAKSGN
jgi:hypothetical protein